MIDKVSNMLFPDFFLIKAKCESQKSKCSDWNNTQYCNKCKIYDETRCEVTADLEVLTKFFKEKILGSAKEKKYWLAIEEYITKDYN